MAGFKTSQVNVRDQHGHQHVLIKTTEVVQVKFENGSTGAKAGASNYTLYGRTVVVLGDSTFESGDLKLRPM